MDIRRYCAAAWTIRANQSFLSKTAYGLILLQLENQADKRIAEILAATRDTPNFVDPTSQKRETLADQLTVSGPQTGAFQNISAFVDRADIIAVRCLGELSWMTQVAMSPAHQSAESATAELVA